MDHETRIIRRPKLEKLKGQYRIWPDVGGVQRMNQQHVKGNSASSGRHEDKDVESWGGWSEPTPASAAQGGKTSEGIKTQI